MRAPLLTIAPLAACAMMADTSNYAGQMRPLAGTCDPASQAVLSLRNNTIIFAPASGTIFLRGALTGATANAQLTLTDPDKHPYQLTFRAVLDGKTMSGTYVTPRCRYAVTLWRTGD